jgi:hypothetical protein
MAGALLGALATSPPAWRIQDAEYIRGEAIRLARMRNGERVESFPYPDLARWKPPATQSDGVGIYGDGLALVGLGELKPIGHEYNSGDAVWQWFALPFGQTILAKRRAKLKLRVTPDLLPGALQATASRGPNQLSLTGLSPVDRAGTNIKRADPRPATSSKRETNLAALDSLTDEVIRSDFDDEVLGRLLNLCIEQFGTIESAVAFASIVAKAKIARQRRSRR